MAYTPELSEYHSATLRRIAWALGKPMTKTIESIFDNLDTMIDPAKVCERCKDKSKCEGCYFNTGERINRELPIDPIKHNFNTEAEMRISQVSVLVSKKVGKKP